MKNKVERLSLSDKCKKVAKVTTKSDIKAALLKLLRKGRKKLHLHLSSYWSNKTS